MAEFHYRGRNNQGASVEGVLEASSKNIAIQQLKKQSVTPTSIQLSKGKATQQTTASSFQKIDFSRLLKRKISLDELIMFCRQMYALSRSGIPLIRAINGLAEATRSPILSEVLHDVSASLTRGITLSNSMRVHSDVFNDLFVSMVRMGETTGQLEQAFAQLIDHLELEKDTRKKISSAVRYPIIVTVFMLIALIAINWLVIPRFTGLFAQLGADLPLPTIVLIATNNFLQGYWLLLLVLSVSGLIGFFAWRRTPDGRLRWHQITLKFPILGSIFERVALGRFARPFAMMLDAGVPLLQALSVSTKTVGNDYIGKGIEGMLNGIERGESLLATASSSGMFNPLILQMIAVGEETGNISALLVDIADFYDQEVEYDLKRLSESIEPILLLAMGFMVLILALGVFLPMWELGASFS